METVIAVKAFIFKNDKLLLVKRHQNDTHCPNVWEVPGGRIEKNENKINGLQREVKEETGLEVIIKNSFATENFVRENGQPVKMTHFICEYSGGEVKLSEEHCDYEWVDKKDVPNKISKFFIYAFNKL
ncbi:MAG: NUDIX domain-containing protein [archaeon]|jgi:ADP-ribose pyrophosphatase YjhB (NUDIX family)